MNTLEKIILKNTGTLDAEVQKIHCIELCFLYRSVITASPEVAIENFEKSPNLGVAKTMGSIFWPLF